eukprot:m.16984 g.16984  ORF g.16984 m.16984 type:complete len:156 (-) comp28721_c0_seq4:4922-5389(-)
MVAKPREGDYPTRCTNLNGYVWVLLVMIGFPMYFYFSCILFKKAGAFWTLLLQSLARPIAAVAFAFPSIVGEENYSPFTVYTGLSFLVILIGVLLRGVPKDPRQAIEYSQLAAEEGILMEDLPARAATTTDSPADGDEERRESAAMDSSAETALL